MVEASVLTKQEFLQPTLPCSPVNSSLNTRNTIVQTSPGIKPLAFLSPLKRRVQQGIVLRV